VSRHHKIYSRARDPHVVAYLDRDSEIQFHESADRKHADAWAACAEDNDWTMVSIHRGHLAEVPRAIVNEMHAEIRARAALAMVSA
jgi:hypothetical protein